ncbi:CAP domain-containing protein [Paenibacillus humicola]|uniref:CAP domain-containing protein n=1 Tax=Paenibacillus humicola TaxID=3110540 RepID=UPI00237AFDC7|nr:CAP domain-containing protein [Paenibacillus humicola]
MKMQPIRAGLAGALAAGMIVFGGAAAIPKAEAATLNTTSVTYNVVSNDTLSKISQRYGIDLNKLIAANSGITNPDVIWPGMSIKLPWTLPWPFNGATQNPQNPQNGAPQYGAPQNGTPQTGTPAGGGTNAGTGAGDVSQSNFASQVISLVNQERAKAGLSALSSDALLTKVALDKAKDMYTNNYFDHNSPTYGSPFDMMRAYGVQYSYAGENIAKGQRSPQEVMNDWMNSSGHRANIMNANYNKIGVAYYNGEWVQEFTS